jgi:thioesterase domain-containing protein
MQPLDLERYLHQEIPLSAAMAVTVRAATHDTVVLEAPLAPNINHHATVFGGSIGALALLAGWSLLHVRLAGVESRVLIQRHSIDYLTPITGAFSASALLEEPQRWDAFITALKRRGRARVRVEVRIEAPAALAARFSGEFVALR